MSKICVDSRKNVLFIVNSILIGGHESQAKWIIIDLLKNNIKVVVLCPDKKVCEFFMNIGVDVYYVPFNIKGKLWKQLLIKRKIKNFLLPFVSNQQEIIVSGGSIEAIINPILTIRSLNYSAHIVSYVPMYIDRSITHGWLGHLYNYSLDAIARITDEFLTINRIQATIIKRRTGIPTKYVQNRIRPLKMPKQSFGPRLVYIGRLDDKQKNITELIKLLDHRDNPFTQFLIIGDGPDYKLVMDAIYRVKYISIHYKGWLISEQVDESIGTDDVLILNSRWEGEPLVVKEFLGKGLICVSREIAGVRGVIDRKYRFKTQLELLGILKNLFYRKFNPKKFYPP
jgi:hypothetical protein